MRFDAQKFLKDCFRPSALTIGVPRNRHMKGPGVEPSLSHISPHTIRIKGWPTRRTADFTSVTRSSAMMTARVAANKPIIMAAVITFTGLYAVCRANTAELNNNRKGGRSILPRVRSASRAAQNRHAASAAHRRPQATAAPMMPLASGKGIHRFVLLGCLNEPSRVSPGLQWSPPSAGKAAEV
jgi:hypothetical protein